MSTLEQARSSAFLLTREGWLRNPLFDLTFIVGVAGLAICAGLVVLHAPSLFGPILIANLWLLGYHHVVSTYTRLAFDRASFLEHKSLVLYLPIFVAAVVSGLVALGSLWLVPTIYLHWQWYHYVRQSEGIAKAYAKKSPDKMLGNQKIARLAFYLTPLAGFALLSSRLPYTFLGLPVETLPIPPEVAIGLCFVAAVAFAFWLNEQIRAMRHGALALPYFLYMLSHFAVYYVAYIYIQTIDHSWLVINIWHNAQYILFVWLYNNKRFSGKPMDKHRLLSTISQNGRLWLYLTVCLGLSTGMYFFLVEPASEFISSTFAMTAAAAGLIIYQTVNFHHYIVDSLIWKLRSKPVRENLGLS